MAAPRPSKAFSKTPQPNANIVSNEGQFLNYLNALNRVIDSNFTQLTNLTNTTFVIDPVATVRTSIAGNTVDVNKIRDMMLTFLQAVKNNGGVN